MRQAFIGRDSTGMILAGPIDWDLDSIFSDLWRLALLVAAAAAAVVVVSAILLTGATVGLTYLRRERSPGTELDPSGDEISEA
jgi:hypothetical protein